MTFYNLQKPEQNHNKWKWIGTGDILKFTGI